MEHVPKHATGNHYLMFLMTKKLMVCNGICSGNQECCCNGANETCGSMYKLLIIDMVKNIGRVEQMANRYIEGKADEYSSKRAWSSIGEQYPEGLTRR